MKNYNKPQIEIVEADAELLTTSGPGTIDIGSPTVSDDAKSYSVWDDDIETHYNNIMEENNYEGKVYK